MLKLLIVGMVVVSFLWIKSIQAEITDCRSWMISEDIYVVLFSDDNIYEDEIESTYDMRLLDFDPPRVLAIADSPCPSR